MAKTLDVICIGRSSVDLYGEQVGGRLEEMASFAKYVGGCPTNISVGTARLGLRPGLITAVGDEHMGRFIKETVTAEGVDIQGVKTDPARLTALVILGIRDEHTFPLIFVRENCADAALTEDDVDEAYIASAGAVVVSGTHFSKPNLDAMSKKAIRLTKKHGGRVIFDIDYRPVLWGLTGLGLGEERFVANESVSAHLQTILPECDVIVGTEEEIHIAGGSTDTLAACRRIRELAPKALIVVKRGPMGCTVFDRAIPDDIEKGIKGPGFPIEVFNILGAGDAFMSGFLRGYLRDEPIEDCCKYANACGAFAVSRHGCAPAVPSWTELADFLEHGSPERALRKDARIEQLHWSTTRTRHLAAGPRDGLRPPRPARGDGGCGGRQPRAYLPLQEALPGGGAARGAWQAGRRHPARWPARPGSARRCDRRCGRRAFVDRPADRAAGCCPGPLRGRRRRRLHPSRMAGGALRQVPDLLPPGRPGGAARRAGGAGAPPVRRLPEDFPRAAAGDHPGQVEGPGRRADARPRARALLRARHLPGLVEAARSGQRCRLARNRRGDRSPRPALPGRPAAGPGSRLRPSSRRASRAPRASRSARASRSGARSSASRPAPGCGARSTMPPRPPAWPRATPV